MTIQNGYVHLYYGNGKGKTTASLGLAIRALGAGKKVCIVQFCKGQTSSEFEIFKTFHGLCKFYKFGQENFIIGKPEFADIQCAQDAFETLRTACLDDDFDMVVADEIGSALELDLISINNVKELIQKRNHKIELILTGHKKIQELIDLCDLVTEMNCVKHYMSNGVPARKGIEF